MKKEKVKITVYTVSEFFGSVQRFEGYLVEHGKKKYAQYDQVPFVIFVPKGKRKAIQILKAYKPYLLILKGWNNPTPEDMFNESIKKEGVTIKQSKYLSFDDRYKTDFDKIINEHQEKFIADYRTNIN